MAKNAKGQFTKGNPGRPKGSKNKRQLLSNARIADYFNEQGFDDLIKEIRKLKGQYKVNAQLKLLEFVMPRQKSIDMTAEVTKPNEDKTIQEIKKELRDLQKLKKEPSWNPNED